MTDHLRVLIVDDDVHIRKLLELYLRDSSHEVHVAATGEEALELAERMSFHVVLLDLILPSFGGFRLCRKLKEGSPNTRVVIMTGDDSSQTRKSAEECGADRFLAKPFAAAEIRAMVAELGQAALTS